MLFRTAALACATAMLLSLAAPAVAEAPSAPRCEEMSFRVYFGHGAAALDQSAIDTLNAAERNVAGCAYSELHVAVDASSPYAAARGQAIMAAVQGRSWNVARVEARGGALTASYANGPEFAEVVMTPFTMPVTAPLAPTNAHVGV